MINLILPIILKILSMIIDKWMKNEQLKKDWADFKKRIIEHTTDGASERDESQRQRDEIK
jgi:hypothetical protein